MGDGGAMFLGFLMATLGLKIRPDGAPFPAGWLVPILILGVPIFDTTLVSISRARRGLAALHFAGKDHTAHRLSNLGLGHRGAVLVALLLGGALRNDRVCSSRASSAGTTYALVGALLFCGFIAVVFLETAPYERQVKLQKSSSRLLKISARAEVFFFGRRSPVGYTLAAAFAGVEAPGRGILASINRNGSAVLAIRNHRFGICQTDELDSCREDRARIARREE